MAEAEMLALGDQVEELARNHPGTPIVIAVLISLTGEAEVRSPLPAEVLKTSLHALADSL